MSSLAWALVKLLAIAAPLVVLAWWLRIFPRRRMVAAALAPAALSLGLLTAPAMCGPILAIDGVLLAVMLADLWTLPRQRAFVVHRESGRIVSLKKRHEVTLTVSNQSRHAYAVTVCDGVAFPLEAEPAEFAFRFEPRSRTTLSYVLRAGRRGAFTLSTAFIRTSSRLGFWRRFTQYPVHTLFHVYPDMKQLGEYALLARTNRLSLLGVRRTRRIGQDHDFERLRDYTIDDNYKHMDWRSTARRQKLTVKDFQSSQSQRLIFLVDCGRMMTNEATGLSLLDHALNAVLMLGYVALRQGDSVGLLSFSDRIHGFVPPRGGMNQMNRLLHASFDRFPQLVESRYDQAFRYLAAHCRKRSLVVLVTNVLDEVNANQTERYLTNLVGRHLPLAVLLRDRQLFDAVEQEEPQGKDLWRAAAAADILAWRQQVLIDLQKKGVLALDVFPEEMAAPLVNRYLEIKARHLL